VGNLIEVDFSERLDRLPPAALVERIIARTEEMQADVDRFSAELREDRWRQAYELSWERQRRKQLERALQDERRWSFPFSDDEIEAALRHAFVDEPLRAGDVAAALGREPTKSIRVRCGQALTRLADAGRVEKVTVKEHGEPRNRWRPSDG
jgi:hypothetical protein